MLRAFQKKRDVFCEADATAKGLVWIDIINPDPHEIATIQKLTELPLEKLNDYLLKDPRPHILTYGKTLIATMSVLSGHKGMLQRTAITFLIPSSTTVITLRTQTDSVTTRIEQQIHESPASFSSSSSFLFATIHEAIEQTFALLEGFDDQLIFLENASSNHPTPVVMKRNYELKRDLIFMHKTLIANREVLVSIEGMRPKQIPDAERYRFLYNDIGQVIEVTDTYREVLTDIIEIYLTAIDTSLNETVKKLTAWGSLILIPTLIASIYGMNFQPVSSLNMPELHWGYGYVFALSLMIISVTGLLIFFKKKKWI